MCHWNNLVARGQNYRRKKDFKCKLIAKMQAVFSLEDHILKFKSAELFSNTETLATLTLILEIYASL